MTTDLRHGDCVEVMRGLEDGSIDACVTDPPYDLTANKRGGSGVASVNLDSPYGRARIGTGNGSGGFMGKAWDATGIAFKPETWAEVLRLLRPGGHLIAFSGTRTYHRMACAIEDAGFEIRDQIGWLYGSGFPKSHNLPGGWGTALKPAWEPICLARKPLIGTVAANVAAHGTGALNIDGCRVEAPDAPEAPSFSPNARSRYVGVLNGGEVSRTEPRTTSASAAGRWPANVAHDGSDEVLEAFAAFGERSTAGNTNPTRQPVGYGSTADRIALPINHRDTGTAARFFFSAKAGRAERGEGNIHPTVKPLALMQWLCRLVTPPGGTVLDPFAGSGSTLIAADREGFHAIGIELESEYVEIARRRLAADAPLLFGAA